MRFALLLAIATSACAQPADSPDERQRRADSNLTPAEVRVDTVVVPVGSLSVAVLTHTIPAPAGGDPAFWAVNLHDNEDTSMDAALEVAAETGGVVVELVHTGDRNTSFQVDGGRTCEADPNRMFTAAGLQRTLDALSETPVPDVCVEAMRQLADHVLTQTGLDAAEVVVTLHNNTDERYSADSYLPGGTYESDAEAVTVHAGSDPDDFFFVTDRDLYDALVALDYNAVLQDNSAATDDGSLSVWAAQNGRPYVNVEAQHGHREAQAEMIRALVSVMSGR